MNARALKFVRHDRIQDHLRKGWMPAIPNAPHHHLHYGIEMLWLCECEVPGGFGGQRKSRRVPITQTESIEA